MEPEIINLDGLGFKYAFNEFSQLVFDVMDGDPEEPSYCALAGQTSLFEFDRRHFRKRGRKIRIKKNRSRH